MATVNRPPFWVPRPPDDQLWQFNTNYKNSGALQLLTQQRVFGQGGQVPTKRWWPHYTLDDPPEWQGAPVHIQSLMLATTELKWYGAPGQVPTKRWAPHFWDDPSPVWQFENNWMSSAAIQILTQQTMFGKGGQVVTKNWSFPFTYDETPPWEFSVNWQSAAAIQLLTHQTIFGAGGQVPTKNWAFPFSYDDPPPWQFESNWMNSAALQLLTSTKIFGQGGQVQPARWNFNYDDPPSWQWEQLARNVNVLVVASTQNPFTPVPWRFNYDDPPMWQGSPIASNIDFIKISIVAAPFYAPSPGEEQFWQFPVERNVNLFPPATAANPFTPVPWRFNYDETPTWQLELNWMNAGTLQQLAFGGKPVVPPPWRFNYDETPTWNAAPVNANINFFPAPTTSVVMAPFYAPSPGEEQFWQPLLWRNVNLFPPVTTTAKPFTNPYVTRFDYDDSAPWVFWRPFATNTTFTLSSFQEYAPRSNWQYFAVLPYDDPPLWQTFRNRNVALLTPPLPPVNVLNIYRTGMWFSYDVMGEPLWQGKPTPGFNLSIPLPPPKNKLFEWIIRARRRGRR